MNHAAFKKREQKEKKKTTGLLRVMCCVLRESRGSTLILSMLIMATIFSSMYVLTSIALRNVRQISSTVRGEVALVGANAALEEGLWAHNREVSAYSGDCDKSPPQYEADNLGGELSQTSILSCKGSLLSNPSDLITVPDNLGTSEREDIKEIYIVDREDPSGPSNYSEANFQWIAGSGTVKVCQWDVTDCSAGPWLANFSMAGSGLPVNVGLNTADDRYILRIEGGGSGFTVRSSGKDESGNGKGLPDDRVTVEGIGRDRTVSRRLEVKISP